MLERLAWWRRRGPGAALRCRKGATAVEWAIIMAPFLTLCFGIIETSLMFFVASTLEGQVGKASRQIRTGVVQQSGNPEKEFRKLLCEDTFIKCPEVLIDVRNYRNFASVAYPRFYNDDGDETSAAFQPGNAGDIVVVRIAYRWNMLTPFMGRLLGDAGSNGKMLNAAAVFRSEPYSGAV